MKDGTEELQKLVTDGRVPLTTATRVAEESREDQVAYVKEVKAGADPVKVAPPDKDGQQKKADCRTCGTPA
ncbi:MAG: hypothetical protein GEV10_13765 [Streptosporangiales bacterium]|nr:hypothetical protein [Streptosporangiales bacterium]